MTTSETFKERFNDALSIRLNGVRYCGNRLQTDGIELYVLTGDYNPVYKQYMEYMGMIHTPTGSINIVSMEENGKLFPWITRTMAQKIEEFKTTIKKG